MKKIHKSKFRKLSVLFSLLASLDAAVCCAEELPLTSIIEAETENTEMVTTAVEFIGGSKQENQPAETVSFSEKYLQERLQDKLELLRLRYRTDFTFAMKIPPKIARLLRTLDQIKENEARNRIGYQIVSVPADAQEEVETASESTFGIFFQDDSTEVETAARLPDESTPETSQPSVPGEFLETTETDYPEAESSPETTSPETEIRSQHEQTVQKPVESAAQDSSSRSGETLVEYTFNPDYRILYEFDFGADSQSEDDTTARYSLEDYYRLRKVPLLPLPKTIRLLANRLRRLIADYSGEWSIYIKNLSTGDELIINDTPMKSASVMKLFIMGTVYDAIADHELERTQEVVDLLHNMITYSSNQDANRLLSLLGSGSYADGIARVNRYIAEHDFPGETHEYNGFEDSSTYCDPDHFNQVSARDCGILLERIYHRTFASRKVCNEIEEMMLNQDTRYKIPKGLPEGISVGNKTGEMDTAENDTAVIYGEKSDYILCVLSNDWDSKDEAIYHISDISSLVYQFFDDETYYEQKGAQSYENLGENLER